MKKILWCLLISFVLFGITPSAFAGLSKGEWTIDIYAVYKTWRPNGDCDISINAAMNENRREMENRRGRWPILVVSWSKGGAWQRKPVDINDSVRIPRAYEVKDWEVHIETGWATESRAREGVFNDQSDGGRIHLNYGVTQLPDERLSVTQFVSCTRQDIVQFFNQGQSQAQSWDWSKNNPPKITLMSSNVSGEWDAGTFLQTFEFVWEAKANPDNPKSRTFQIELAYGESIDKVQFYYEVGTKKIRLSDIGAPKKITLSVPQSEVIRFSHLQKARPILINAFQWKVIELIEGRDFIEWVFFMPISSTITIS